MFLDFFQIQIISLSLQHFITSTSLLLLLPTHSHNYVIHCSHPSPRTRTLRNPLHKTPPYLHANFKDDKAHPIGDNYSASTKMKYQGISSNEPQDYTKATLDKPSTNPGSAVLSGLYLEYIEAVLLLISSIIICNFSNEFIF